MFFRELTHLMEMAPLAPSLEIKHFAIDSRQVQEGSLFFALAGARVNGHQFLKEVSQKGAIAAVVESSYDGPTHGLILIRVKDPFAFLQQLAKRYREELPCQELAITGSLGKTTTKEFCRHLLSSTFQVTANPGTYNTKLTLPLSVLNCDKAADWLILEMGMTHLGDIAKLTNIAPPDVSVITNISYAHAWNFPDGQAGIAKAKVEIFENPRTQIGIYNADMPYADLASKTGACEKISFSMRSLDADFSMRFSDGRMYFYERGRKMGSLLWTLPGTHLLPNFLAAYAVARTLKTSFKAIEEQMPTLVLPDLRMQPIEKNGVLFINDAYNASSPDAVIGALSSFPKPKEGGRKIAVLGSMRELGQYSEEAHTLVAHESLTKVDTLFCLGEETETMQRIWQEKGRSAELFLERSALVDRLKDVLKSGDVVLLKGSRSLSMDKIIEEWSKA